MDYINVMQSGVLGNVAYDFLKYGIPLAFNSFKDALKNKGHEWLLDEQGTQNILARASELYKSEQDVEQYNQIIQQDSVLAELLKSAIQPHNQNTLNFNDSIKSTGVAGDVGTLTVNHYATVQSEGNSPIKKL